MSGSTLKLGSPAVAAVIDERHAAEPDGWRKRRLLAVKLAAKGEYTSAEVAELCWNLPAVSFRVAAAGARGRAGRTARARQARAQGGHPARGQAGGHRGAGRTAGGQSVCERRGGAALAGKGTRCRAAVHHGVELARKNRAECCGCRGRRHSKANPDAPPAFKSSVAEKLEALGIEAGSRVKVWFMDEARFGLHTEMRRVWTLKGVRPVVSRQIKYEWDYLYGALSAVGGEAHFAHLPSVSLEWDQSYLRDLAASDPGAIHVLVRDQAGFHLRDGDPRLPAQVRIIDLPPYSPELNPCEQLWDILKDDICNQVHATIAALRERMGDTLRRYWEDAKSVLRLIGRDWFLSQLNAIPKTHLSVYFEEMVSLVGDRNVAAPSARCAVSSPSSLLRAGRRDPPAGARRAFRRGRLP